MNFWFYKSTASLLPTRWVPLQFSQLPGVSPNFVLNVSFFTDQFSQRRRSTSLQAKEPFRVQTAKVSMLDATCHLPLAGVVSVTQVSKSFRGHAAQLAWSTRVWYFVELSIWLKLVDTRRLKTKENHQPVFLQRFSGILFRWF